MENTNRMTFTEAYAAMVALATERGDSDMNIEVTAWARCDGCADTIDWSIWCGSRQKHYRGATAEKALAAYRADVEVGGAPVTADALSAVGAI